MAGNYSAVDTRTGGTRALSLSQGLNLVHDACLVALGRTPPERLRFADAVRAKRDPFSLLGSRDPGLVLRALDSRWQGSISNLDDPLPLVQTAWRMLARKLRLG